MFGSLTVIKTLYFFVCPRELFRQINDFSRGFILKVVGDSPAYVQKCFIF